jgi:hypothetical protein
MNAIKATTYRDGHNRCHHCEASKCSRNEPLERYEEGRGDQPWSRKLPRQRMRQECRDGIISITTILTPR